LNSDEPLVTWKLIANRLNLQERAFWRLVHEQGLPHYRLNGRVIRFRWSEVEQWLEGVRKGVA
jgi:excisionase family DNA binding protein